MAHRSFLEKTLADLASTIERTVYAEALTRRAGLLQGLDARVKVLLLGFTLVVAASLRTLPMQLALLVLLSVSLATSRIPASIMVRLGLGLPVFTLLVAAPALVLLPGPPLVHLPFGLTISTTGALSVLTLLLRVAASVFAAAALVLTTRWSDLLAALRALRVPLVFVVVLAMAYRYVFVLLDLVQDLILARRSRTLSALPGPEQRRWLATALAVLLQRSLRTSEQVYQAMTARGFRGEPRTLRLRALTEADWFTLSVGSAACAALWLIDLAHP